MSGHIADGRDHDARPMVVRPLSVANRPPRPELTSRRRGPVVVRPLFVAMVVAVIANVPDSRQVGASGPRSLRTCQIHARWAQVDRMGHLRVQIHTRWEFGRPNG